MVIVLNPVRNDRRNLFELSVDSARKSRPCWPALCTQVYTAAARRSWRAWSHCAHMRPGLSS